jgi:hypothetical protein
MSPSEVSFETVPRHHAPKVSFDSEPGSTLESFSTRSGDSGRDTSNGPAKLPTKATSVSIRDRAESARNAAELVPAVIMGSRSSGQDVPVAQFGSIVPTLPMVRARRSWKPGYQLNPKWLLPRNAQSAQAACVSSPSWPASLSPPSGAGGEVSSLSLTSSNRTATRFETPDSSMVTP